MITNVVIRIMRLKGQGDSDKDQMCCKTPKIQEITVRYIIPVILATLRRYCVHSTLVPVVVPIFFFPHTIGKTI